MDTELFPSLAASFMLWIQAYPELTYLAIVLMIAVESLFVIGLFIPGSAIMIALGVVISLDGLPFWPVFWATCLGALLGDGFNYWLGLRYRGALRAWPWVQQHPQWLSQAERFLVRHGAKSLIVARIIGPLRPFIPAVAGMLDMPPKQFWSVTALAVLLWAPLFLGTGMFVGASLQLIANVAMRLAVLFGGLLLALWAIGWLVIRLHRLVILRFHRWLTRHLPHAHQYALLRALTRGEHTLHHPQISVLLEIILVLALALSVFFALVFWQMYRNSPLPFDYPIYYFLSNLRTPWADHVMLGLVAASHVATHGLVAGVISAYLVLRGHLLPALYVSATLSIAGFSAWHWHRLLPVVEPSAQTGASGADIQLTMAVTLFGFLALLLARGLARVHRAWPYALSGMWIFLLAVAQLYLARLWLSEAITACALGLFWVGFFGLLYHRHPTLPFACRGWLAVVTLIALLSASAWQIARHHSQQMAIYQPQMPRFTISQAQWRTQKWQELNLWRQDSGTHQQEPMNLQWAASLSQIQQCLRTQGWEEVPPLSLPRLMWAFIPSTPLAKLPLAPLLHNGHHESLRMIKQPWLIRLWPSNYMTPATPIWVGNVTQLARAEYWHLFTLPQTQGNFTAGAQFLVQQRPYFLPPHDEKVEHRGMDIWLLENCNDN